MAAVGREFLERFLTNYGRPTKVTLRKLNAQFPLSAGFVTEYVPLIFNGAVVDPEGTEFGGNVNVTVAPAPGAKFVIAAGAESSDPEPSVAEFTCRVLTVTFPVFVIVT